VAQRGYDGGDAIEALFDELNAAVLALRGAWPEPIELTQVSGLDRLMDRQEAIEAPVLAAAQRTFGAAEVTEHTNRWKTLRDLVAGLRELDDQLPYRLDEMASLMFDHGVYVAAFYAKLHYLLDDAGYAAMTASIQEAVINFGLTGRHSEDRHE
jgi:hypothetical protein